MALAARISPVLAALASIAFAPHAMAQTTAGLPTGQAAAPQAQPVLACAGLGPGFLNIPGTQTCLRIGADVFIETRGDFVSKDLSIETRRISAPVPDTPIALYSAVDESRTANRYQQQSNGRITLTAVTPVDGAPLVSFVSIRSGYDDNAADQRARPQTANTGVGLEQAWISGLGFTAGLRSSVFDFSSGYTYSGGYASQRILNQLAFEKKVSDQASIALSLEDGIARRYQEGVWALYGPQRFPDVVLRGRLDANWGTVHLAAAAHSIRDSLTDGGAMGWAVNAGVEYKQDWGKIFPDAQGSYGRVLATAAYADGALDYLGVPHFSTDYVVDSDGSIVPTKGASALVSYEHLWSANFKSTATLALYRTQATLKDFTWSVEGGLAQIGAEYNPAPGTFVGGELSYAFDRAQGTYFDVPGANTPVSYLQAFLYLRRSI